MTIEANFVYFVTVVVVEQLSELAMFYDSCGSSPFKPTRYVLWQVC